MGSIRKSPRNPDRWEARYRDPAGGQRSRTFDTKGAARAYLTAVEGEIQRDDFVDPALKRTLFAEWADEWLSTIRTLEPRTQAWYEGMLIRHVLPTFGQLPIGVIQQVHVRQFVTELSASGAGPRTVKGAYTTARQVFATAVGSGAIRSNPCDGVKLPRIVERDKLFLTADQVATLEAALPDQYALLVVFAAYTGLRAGELGGLRVGRLDLLRGKVEVAETLIEVRGHLSFGPTKNHERRTVGVPRFLCDRLGEHLAGRSSDQLVFTAPEGGPLRHSAFYRRVFKPAVIRAGLDPALRFHDLRHTTAALLIAEGAHPRAIMERLGHSSIEITMNVYGGLFPSLDESLTDALDRVYAGAAPAPNATVVELLPESMKGESG